MAAAGQARQDGATIRTAKKPVFAPLVVCDPAPAPSSCERLPAEEQIRIVIGGARLELAADTPAVRLAEIVQAFGAVLC